LLRRSLKKRKPRGKQKRNSRRTKLRDLLNNSQLRFLPRNLLNKCLRKIPPRKEQRRKSKRSPKLYKRSSTTKAKSMR